METIYYNDISNLAVEVFSKKVKSTLDIIKNAAILENEEKQTVEEQITNLTVSVEKVLTGFRFYSFTKENCFALWEMISKDAMILDLVLESCDVFFLRLVQVESTSQLQEPEKPFQSLAETLASVITLGRKGTQNESKSFFANLTKNTTDDYYIANDEFFARGMEKNDWLNLFLCNPWLLYIAVLKTSNVDLLEFFGMRE